VLSGTPGDATFGAGAIYTFSVTATDSLGATGTKAYTLTVDPPLTFSPTTLPNATVGAPYLESITASGGTGPYVYNVGGTPPPFLSISSLTDAVELSGTPAASGTYNFSVTAKDADGVMGTQSYTLTVALPPLTLGPSPLRSTTAGFPYTTTLTASGGTGPYAFSFTGNPPPSFLQLSSSGVLGGTPAAPGTYSFSVTATDALGATGTQNYSLTVVPPLTFNPPTLPNATVGVNYVETITAGGGHGFYFYTVDGTPPPFIFVNNVEGGSNVVLGGTPAASGTYNFSVTAKDADGVMGTQSYTLTVALPPGVSSRAARWPASDARRAPVLEGVMPLIRLLK
jgi:hypothetical protein